MKENFFHGFFFSDEFSPRLKPVRKAIQSRTIEWLDQLAQLCDQSVEYYFPLECGCGKG